MKDLLASFRRLGQKIAAEKEAESRTWIYHCTNCGFEISAWDAGDTIWKGSGGGLHWMRCRNCGKVTRHKLYRKQDENLTNNE